MRQPRTRTRVSQLLAVAIGGCVGALGSAWLIAAFASPPPVVAFSLVVCGDGYSAELAERNAIGFKVCTVSWSRNERCLGKSLQTGVIPAWSRLSRPQPELEEAAPDGNVVASCFATGFPVPCLAVEAHRLYFNIGKYSPPRDEGISIDRKWPKGTFGLSNPRRLPTRPIWWAFTLDVVFWSAILTAATWGPGSLRRSRRRRRGLCLHCAYPLRSLGICPECGCDQVHVGAHPPAPST